MRRGWVFLLLAAAAGAQEFSEEDLDRAIREIERGGLGDPGWLDRVTKWGPRAARAAPTLLGRWGAPGVDDALRAMGFPAVPHIAKAVSVGNPATREYAGGFLERLAQVPPGGVLDAALEGTFVDLLDHEDPRVRAAAARGLASLGPAAAPKVLPLLSVSSPRRRHGATLALSWIDPPPEEALAPLVAATADKDALVRAGALVAISRLRESEQVIKCLIAALGDRSEAVVSAAVAELARRGPGLVATVVAAWDDDAAAPHATEVLVRLGDAAIGPAAEAVRSGDARRKRNAAACLGRIAAARDVPLEGVLATALKDPDAEVRLASAVALGIATPPAAARSIEALLASTKDGDPRVRAASLAAASRAAPQEPRVVDLLRAAKLDADPALKLTAAAAAAKTPEECGAVAKSPVAPVAARLRAAERARDMVARPGAAVEALGRVVGDRGLPPDLRAAAADAIAGIGQRRLFELRYEPREDPATKGFRAAADRAITWLGLSQRVRDRGGDGRWKCDGISSVNYDVGVTGLALLTYLAAGRTHRAPGADSTNVREGIEWLLSRQTPEGLIREGTGHDHTLLEHAIATHALCELVGMTGDESIRPSLQKAVDYCVASRSTYGWQYVSRGPKSNTNVTTWMLVALWSADQIGLDVDPMAFEGGRQWIDKMTEPTFGQVGYDYPGGQASRPKGSHDRFPPEKTFSTTAGGGVCRIWLGEDPGTSEMVKKGVLLCLEQPPKWNTEDGSIDMYYWYYGSLVTFQAGDASWSKWVKPLGAALLPNQTGGAWKAVDPWGDYGGSIYATTMCTLALLTPWRYPRGACLGGKPPPAYASAVAALREAASSPCERVRLASRRALSRCPGGK